jgi:ATP-binding cassette subfamily F protein 3
MRHALSVALQSFEGGLIVVSHDRHLIKSAADTLWLVADGKLRTFDGDLDEYQLWLKERSRTSAVEAARPARPPRQRDTLAEWRRQLEQIERKIAAIAAERTSMEAGSNGADDKRAERIARLERDAAKWEARWIEVGTAIEEAEAQGTG